MQSRLNTIAPIAWFALVVSYGENANRVVSDYVDQIIRKASQNVFALLTLDWSTDFWGIQLT